MFVYHISRSFQALCLQQPPGQQQCLALRKQTLGLECFAEYWEKHWPKNWVWHQKAFCYLLLPYSYGTLKAKCWTDTGTKSCKKRGHSCIRKNSFILWLEKKDISGEVCAETAWQCGKRQRVISHSGIVTNIFTNHSGITYPTLLVPKKMFDIPQVSWSCFFVG